MLRPLTNDEHWTLYYFEEHAAKCKSCHNPLKVSKAGKRLCDVGQILAIDVASLVMRCTDGKIYSRHKDGHLVVCVEIPRDYVETMSLLKAIQRGSKTGNHFLVDPESRHRTYYAAHRRVPAVSFESRVAKSELQSALNPEGVGRRKRGPGYNIELRSKISAQAGGELQTTKVSQEKPTGEYQSHENELDIVQETGSVAFPLCIPSGSASIHTQEEGEMSLASSQFKLAEYHSSEKDIDFNDQIVEQGEPAEPSSSSPPESKMACIRPTFDAELEVIHSETVSVQNEELSNSDT